MTTVKELIDKLSSFAPEMEVQIQGHWNRESLDLDAIHLFPVERPELDHVVLLQ